MVLPPNESMAFRKGKRVGFALGKSYYSQAELQASPRVFLEGVAIKKGLPGARHIGKAQLMAYILAHNGFQQGGRYKKDGLKNYKREGLNHLIEHKISQGGALNFQPYSAKNVEKEQARRDLKKMLDRRMEIARKKDMERQREQERQERLVQNFRQGLEGKANALLEKFRSKKR